ncbi:MAG: hypothetical protein ACLUKN_00475 [Bacilli bacterium]
MPSAEYGLRYGGAGLPCGGMNPPILKLRNLRHSFEGSFANFVQYVSYLVDLGVEYFVRNPVAELYEPRVADLSAFSA